MITFSGNYKNNNINTFKSKNPKIVIFEEPKTKIIKDTAFFCCRISNN